MTLAYLLDTNVISELAKQNPDSQVQGRFAAHEMECALAAPTIEELAFGVARLPPSRRRTHLGIWLEAVVARIPILPFDAGCALWLGRERARLLSQGRPVSRADGEIAAVAVRHGLALATRNQADFRAFESLRLENWFSASG